jgi:beta-glucuronidase
VLRSLPHGKAPGGPFFRFVGCVGSVVEDQVAVNRKGVFTRDRRPKMAAHKLREIWATRAGG